MVASKPPTGMRWVWGYCRRFFDSDVPPVAWRQLVTMCWIRWKYRHDPLLPEILDDLYWRTLPRGLRQQWFEDEHCARVDSVV